MSTFNQILTWVFSRQRHKNSNTQYSFNLWDLKTLRGLSDRSQYEMYYIRPGVPMKRFSYVRNPTQERHLGEQAETGVNRKEFCNASPGLWL